jgi:hypothetical protein
MTGGVRAGKNRVSVSCARTADRGLTGGRVTRVAQDGRDLIGA